MTMDTQSAIYNQLTGPTVPINWEEHMLLRIVNSAEQFIDRKNLIDTSVLLSSKNGTV